RSLVRMAHEANVTSGNVKIEVEGDAGELVADIATPLAVAIAELLQNAVEHAFRTQTAAEHTVQLRFQTSAKELTVEICDNGTGFPDGFAIDETQSLGLAIVRDLISSQLGGTITIENASGALVRLLIPYDKE